jgi:hypothetical protein
MTKAKRKPQMPVRSTCLVLRQLTEAAHDAGLAAARAVNLEIPESKFRDRPKAMQRGFVAMVSYVLEWAAQNARGELPPATDSHKPETL